MKKRITAILLSVLLIVGILPMSGLLSATAEDDGTALAEFLFYNKDEKVFQKSVCTQYTAVNSTATAWESGWYAADGEIVLESRVSVTGDVFLILKDGCSLTVRGGITVSEGNSLTVFAQSQGENAGALTADAGDLQECSGIGSAWGRKCGTVNLHGGRITATGGMEASGLGSANGTDGGTVNIYGGSITANSVREGAGIGCGNGGAVSVFGGIVNAGCENHGAGIDGSFAIFGGNVTARGGDPDGTGFRGTCRINGGAFRADGGYVGTGISGSVETAADIDLINLFDGTKYTKGEGRAWTDVFGSGSVFVCGVNSREPLTYLAYDTETGALTHRECKDYQFIHNNTQTLSGGLYVVTGTLDLGGIQVIGDVGIVLTDWSILSASEKYYKAGIEVLRGNTLTVYAQSDGDIAGKLFANGGYQCAGIGGIEKKLVGTVNIHGGVVCATGGANGAGIGGGDGYAAGTVNIYGGTVYANGNDCGAGIGGGNFGPGGKVNIYGGVVNATGSNGGAGIGGGSGGTGDEVNIYGGIVNAVGNDAAGIGGGFAGYAADVSIFGGKVSAVGGRECLAIGNGKNQRENKLGSLTIGENLSVVNTETGEPIRKGEGEEWLSAVKCQSVFISDPSEEPVLFEKTDYLAYDNGGFLPKTCEKEAYIPCPGLSLWQYAWYEVEGKLTLDAVRIQGDVNLILKDGCELTVQGGINVEAGNRLTIYAQSDGDAAGKLIADGSVFQAGIGSGLDKDCGSIVIEGGNITARGGACAAGIGGGSGTPYGGDILICGGVVFAKGQDGGAGIGNGYYDYADYDEDVMEFTDKATAGNITIRGGNVTAKGSAYAAGIGGGEGSDGGHITICSGSITAESGEYAEAAIGDGCFALEDSFVTVYGGTVTALPENGGALKTNLADGSEAYGSPYKTETDITADIRSASWIHMTFYAKWVDNTPTPQTGDSLFVLLGVFVITAVGIAACLVSVRKKRKAFREY